MSIAKRTSLAVLMLVLLGLAGTAWALHNAGYRAYVVRTGSMSPAYPAGDLVLNRPAAVGYTAGDVITFRHSSAGDLVTHRITDITDEKIHTKGDANRTADVWDIYPTQVQGVVQARVPNGGYLVVFMQQPTGVAGAMTGGLGLVLLWGLFFPADPRVERSAKGLAPQPA